MSTTVKPWGEERIVEANSSYVLKRLSMRAGNRCSLQYHEKKTETIYVLEGTLCLTVRNHIVEMNPGDSVTIYPRTRHRMQGITDVVYLEASTPELDDVVRIEDDYDRV